MGVAHGKNRLIRYSAAAGLTAAVAVMASLGPWASAVLFPATMLAAVVSARWLGVGPGFLSALVAGLSVTGRSGGGDLQDIVAAFAWPCLAALVSGSGTRSDTDSPERGVPTPESDSAAVVDRMAHDLVQPLGAITTYAELIRMRPDGDVHRQASRIQEVAARMAVQLRLYTTHPSPAVVPAPRRRVIEREPAAALQEVGANGC